jgi:Iron-containing alcohol dehydrogenase
MRRAWNFHTAGQLTFGPGAVSQLGDLVRRRGATRVLLLTDANLVAAGIADTAHRPLAATGLTVATFAASRRPARRQTRRPPEPAEKVRTGGGSRSREPSGTGVGTVDPVPLGSRHLLFQQAPPACG